jgi:hypothetical protein
MSANAIIMLNVLWLLAVVLGAVGVATYYLNRAVDQSGR